VRCGASLAYGGAFTPKGTLKQVLIADREAPQELGNPANRMPRVRNYLGYPASQREKDRVAPNERNSVEFIPLSTISVSELEELCAPRGEWFEAMSEKRSDAYDPRRHVAWAISLFRLRVRMIQDVSALVVLGGKDDGQSWGRMVGIAEEVMIALALRKPIYVLGGAGGAAQAVGKILGLDQVTVGIERCLKPAAYDALAHALAPYTNSFDIPGEPESPKDLTELRRFLFYRGVTTAS
jgi:hypothetical protein